MRRFLLFIFVIIIIPLTITLALLWTTLFTINNSNTIKFSLGTQNAYSKIVSLLPQYLTQKDDSPIIFNEDQKARIIKTAFPVDYVKTTVEDTVDNIYAWVNGKKSTFQINISLSQAKDNAKDEIVSIYKEKYASLPECTSSELLMLKIQSEQDFPTCRIPPDNRFTSLYQTFDPAIVTTKSLDSFPDKIEFSLPKNLEKVPLIFGQFKLLLQIATIVDLFLLSLAVYLLFPFKKKLFQFLGLLFVIIGLALVAFNFFVIEIINGELTNKINYGLSNNTELKNVISPLFNSMINDIKNIFHIFAVVATISGLICLIIALIAKNKSSDKKYASNPDSLKIDTKI